MSVHRSLLQVELFELSSKTIYQLRKSHKNPNEVFELIPEFTINTNEGANNRPVTAEFFQQFIGLEKDTDTKHLYFNLNVLDQQLDYEVGMTGKEEFFENIVHLVGS